VTISNSIFLKVARSSRPGRLSPTTAPPSSRSVRHSPSGVGHDYVAAATSGGPTTEALSLPAR